MIIIILKKGSCSIEVLNRYQGIVEVQINKYTAYKNISEGKI